MPSISMLNLGHRTEEMDAILRLKDARRDSSTDRRRRDERVWSEDAFWDSSRMAFSSSIGIPSRGTPSIGTRKEGDRDATIVIGFD